MLVVPGISANRISPRGALDGVSQVGHAPCALMGRRSPTSPLRHSRWGSAAGEAALGSPVVAGDGDRPAEGNRRAGYRAGPGVAHVPDMPAVGVSDAGEPARPDAKPVATDLLTPEAAASGFTAYWVGDQLRLAHHCRNVTTVAEPTSALVGWHVRTHRCGTPGSAWHVRGGPAELQPRDPTRPAHLVPRSVGRP
jgi:hypothetical protein